MNVMAAGRLSCTTTFWAKLPLFETVKVYVTVPFCATVLGDPLFVMLRSGSGVAVIVGVRVIVAVFVTVVVAVAVGQPTTVVDDDAVLLLKLLSAIVKFGFTIAVLTNGETPTHGPMTCTTIVIVALLKPGMFPPEQAIWLFGAGRPQLKSLVPDASSRITPDGRLSVTVTGNAAAPPMLATVREYVTTPPAATVLGWLVFEIVRSAGVAGVRDNVVVGVLVAVDDGPAVPVVVAVEVLVAIDAVMGTVAVRVGVAWVPMTELPGKPQPRFVAPMAAPDAFSGITTTQMRPPLPVRLAVSG
jgi:uncharacterized membrane protein